MPEFLHGTIIKGVGGLYSVQTECGLFECKARGLFRIKDQTPLVGERVTLSVVDGQKREGYLHEIHERKNSLLRPKVVNVDQTVIVFAIVRPLINLEFLDKLLIHSEMRELPIVICLNKTDLDDGLEYEQIAADYRLAGYQVVCVSAVKNSGIDELMALLEGKISVLTGPSGVGKSSIINALRRDDTVETGELSEKIDRGRHTTRHTELMPLSYNTFIIDTPGFTSLELPRIRKLDLPDYYPEFKPFIGGCYFGNCLHVSEPDCAVKAEIGKEFPRGRYERYCGFSEQLKMDLEKY